MARRKVIDVRGSPQGMSGPPYQPFYWRDYFAATRGLSALEHGAYLLLLGEMWEAGGKLPADDRRLAKLFAARRKG